MEREEEREEVERRRALPAAQRDAEDEEYARRTREQAKDNRGERAFLEKFWHKGAFHQVCCVSVVRIMDMWINDIPQMTGRRDPQEELQRQAGVNGGCVAATQGHAGQEFRQGEWKGAVSVLHAMRA